MVSVLISAAKIAFCFATALLRFLRFVEGHGEVCHHGRMKKRYVGAQIAEEFNLLYYVVTLEWKTRDGERKEDGNPPSGMYAGVIQTSSIDKNNNFTITFKDSTIFTFNLDQYEVVVRPKNPAR